MRRILLLTIWLTALLPTWAKDDRSALEDVSLAKNRYRNITMNDGLAANAVRNIVQDKYGFIWFGTDNGLCRYDGMKVQPYRISELGANQYVSALLAVDEGLYIGTEKGVFLFSFERQAFEKQDMDIHTTVSSMTLDKEGALWISTLGQGVWCRETRIQGGTEMVAQVYVDNSNQVWTVTNQGYPVVYRLNRLHNRFEPLKLDFPDNYNSLRMLQTKDGRLWLGTWESGLLQLHSDGRLEQVLNPRQAHVGNHIHTLFERDESCICIGCDDGVICLNPQTHEWHRLIRQQSLADRFVYSITSDMEGGLWIGTFYGGVNYISPVGKRFEALSMENGLHGHVIARFCEDRKGRVWVASDDGGLMCYSPKGGHFTAYPHQDILSLQNVHALCADGDELWIGTYTSGVMVLNVETGELHQYLQTEAPHSLNHSSSYAISRDSRGDIWVATMEGLNRFDRSRHEFERIGKVDALTIDIDEDRDGNLWFSTQGGGLWKYETRSGTFKTYTHRDDDKHSIPDD